MKLWGGRFQKGTSGLMDDFHSSISFDQRLFEEDILGSIAHATMLGKQGIISEADTQSIVEGLKEILADAKEGSIQWRVDAEDIHMNVESILTEESAKPENDCTPEEAETIRSLLTCICMPEKAARKP